MARSDTTANLQKRAWGYYGWPGTENHAVGEVRYVVGWLADQMTRLEWDVIIDGSEEWEVTDIPTKDGETVSISTERDGEQDLTAASMELLELIDWTDTNIRAITTNLFVGGQGNYIEDTDRWRVVSVVEKNRRDKIKAAKSDVPFLWPHPADPEKPDAPLFSVLDLLDELEWLNRQARAQSRQRVLHSGIVVTADGFEGPPNGDGTPSTFWDEWNATMDAHQSDPDNMSPVRLQGPGDLVKEGVNWILPPFGYDAVIDRRILAGINRLAYGLPIPPEILLGMQAQSRATAFQVEENAYRAHIEPPAWMVAQVGEDSLTLVLDEREIVLRPNPSKMLARKQSVEDVKWARTQNLVNPDYTREVLGIPEDAAPEENDGVPISSTGGIASDPANDAADEPVAAAARTPNLSDLLADIDASLSSELAGVTVMATDRARQRLGAAARSNEQVRGNTAFKGMKSAELASVLGLSGLEAAGVDVAAQIAEPIDSAARWWVRRIGEAWAQAATLVPGWAGQGDWVESSVLVLSDALTAHVAGTLDQPEPPPLEAGDIRSVVDAAAGDN